MREQTAGMRPVSTAHGKAPCPSQPPSLGLGRGGLRAEAWRGTRRQAREALGPPDGTGRGPGVGTAVWGQARSHQAPRFRVLCPCTSLTLFLLGNSWWEPGLPKPLRNIPNIPSRCAQHLHDNSLPSAFMPVAPAPASRAFSSFFLPELMPAWRGSRPCAQGAQPSRA